MTSKHSDYFTLLSNPDDRDILTRPLFDVNLRLLQTSEQYRNIVEAAADYILWAAQTEKIGYKKPHGCSGANVGIPFNIIATPTEVMLNPHILTASGEVIGESNCGSLLLEKPIRIKRFAQIKFEYWDMENLTRHERVGYYPTIQHEIDHNLGILITDRRA